MPIKDLCGNFAVRVLSHDGKYHQACGALTQKKAEVITLHFEDGANITCTPDHRFMLSDGARWKEARCLTPHDLIRCVTYDGDSDKRDVPGVQRSKILPLRVLFQFSKKASGWFKEIASSGLGILQWANSEGVSHPPQGWQPIQQPNNQPRTIGSENSLIKSYDTRASSSSETKHASSCRSDGKILAQVTSRQGVALGACQENSGLYASHKENVYFLWSGVSNQKAHGVEVKILPSQLQDGRKTTKVKSISYFQAPQDVYCLNVPDTSTFVLSNGAVVHNCDALRYLCKARLIDSKWEQPAEVFNKGLVKLQAYISQMRRPPGLQTLHISSSAF